MAERIVVRFAPSPTGSLHVGSARTALFNWLFARKYQGKFILRIEDTDIARSKKEYEKKIINELKWLGIDWDEGPYRQSERLPLYKKYALKLLEQGKAYYCFCREEELKARRKQALTQEKALRYDGRCKKLSEKEKERLYQEGRKPAIRFIVENKKLTVHDLIRGEVSFDTTLIGDFVIIKSNHTPTYNFAVVVDDLTMGISHVIRGDEHLANTPKQILLFEAIGEQIPFFAHLSMILSPDHTKLSKRHGATSVEEFIKKGYLPEAFINYLALLGWSPKKEREIFSLQELIEEYSLEGIARNPAVFDINKLNWMNGYYIRNKAPTELVDITRQLLSSHGYSVSTAHITNIIEVLQNKLLYMEQIISDYGDLFFQEEITLDEEAQEVIEWEWTENVLHVLKKILQETDITRENFSFIMKQIQKETNIKGKNLYLPIRMAVTGKIHGPELNMLLPALGRERILKRIEKILTKIKT